MNETEKRAQYFVNIRNSMNGSVNAMLKMELTDGKTTCYAIEYTPIPSLTIAIKRGAKIAVQNVRVENGLLLLNPTNVLLLGGTVCGCFLEQTWLLVSVLLLLLLLL